MCFIPSVYIKTTLTYYPTYHKELRYPNTPFKTVFDKSLVQSDIPHLPLPLRLTFCHLLISGALLIKRMGRRLSERLAVKRNSFLFDIRF